MTRRSLPMPERISPDSNASPITPAPKTAICCAMTCPSAAGREGSEEQSEVGGSFRHATYQIAVPLLAVRQIDAHGLATAGEAELLVRADTMQHLVLVRARPAAMPHRKGTGHGDQPGIVRGHHGIPVPGHQDPQAAHVRLVDLLPVAEGDRLGLVVGALAQPHPGARTCQVTAVAHAPL